MTTIQSIEIGGSDLVVMTRKEYDRLVKASGKDVPAKSAIRAAIAQDILLARRRNKMTQTQLAKASGVRQETISRLEAGKHDPDEKTIQKIMKAMKA